MGYAYKHLVHGEWMTVSEAAERLGLAKSTIYNYQYEHRRQDGGPGLLVDAWDHYSSGAHKSLGRPPRRYYVNGKLLTMEQAAASVRVKLKTFRQYVYKRGCTVQGAVRFYRKRAEDQAVREITAIILRGDSGAAPKAFPSGEGGPACRVG